MFDEVKVEVLRSSTILMIRRARLPREFKHHVGSWMRDLPDDLCAAAQPFKIGPKRRLLNPLRPLPLNCKALKTLPMDGADGILNVLL